MSEMFRYIGIGLTAALGFCFVLIASAVSGYLAGWGMAIGADQHEVGLRVAAIFVATGVFPAFFVGIWAGSIAVDAM